VAVDVEEVFLATLVVGEAEPVFGVFPAGIGLASACQRETLVLGLSWSGDLYQDDSALYWATSTGSGGQVMRLAK
jgi:hypothetical protein